MIMREQKIRSSEIAAYIFVAIALLIVLLKGLLAALFSGLLVYSLIQLMIPLLGKKVSGERKRMIAVTSLSVVVVALLTFAIWQGVLFLQSDAGNFNTLLKKLADIIEASRNQFPAWLQHLLPVNADALSQMIITWLREHAVEAKTIGTAAGRTVAHVLIGMIVGAMAAFYDASPDKKYAPFSGALRDRISHLHIAFRNVVFAQVRISAINTLITAIFILIVLPMAGISLPLSKSMIAITFFAGLLPVVGNLISNTVLVIVSLSHSLHTAIGSLLFLVTIHKLEYFLNARIIGLKINAHVWELLVVMLAMESLFGLPGLVAAPVFYAYVKNELSALKLI